MHTMHTRFMVRLAGLVSRLAGVVILLALFVSATLEAAYEAETQTRGYVENDKRVLRELADHYDPDIPAHENEPYVAKTKELFAGHGDAMRGSGAIFGDRSDRAWLPPSKGDVDAVTAEHADQLGAGRPRSAEELDSSS